MSPTSTAAVRAPLIERWSALTRLPRKAEVYARDPLARTALSLVPDGHLFDLALVVVKPEALLTGRMTRVRRFLDRRQLTVVAHFDTELDAARSHQLWQYPWVKATTDRMRLHILLSQGLPSRCLLVRRVPGSGEIPLTTRLAVDKGSSDAAQRRPGQLRTELGMTNRMISFVHTSDEPADLLRDVYVLGGEEALTLLGSTTAQPDLVFEDLAGSEDLEADTLLAGLPSAGRERLRALLEARRRHGHTLDLDAALRAVTEAGATEDRHRHVLAAGLIPHDLPDVVAEFDAATVAELAARWAADHHQGE
ncbi:hypothetical protein ACTD5D_31570 [Nocardia takedensis]|uniref:hypothetical protein n=1 Tax=Nocardia takedensis TaxID=259390 RepID=UPI0002F3E6CE|nr:hypothetical protein [Nocardia takedensis]